MGARSIKLELSELIHLLPEKKLGRARDLIRALINDKVIKDNLSEEDVLEIKKGIEDTEKGKLYSVAESIAEYKATRKKKK